MSKVRWAIWGSCGIAKRRTIPEGLIPAENAELISIYDVNTEANMDLAKQLGVAALSSEQALIESPAEAIYIATPAYLHHKQVLACAKAGKHVLCEKPMGMTTEEAEQMMSACKDAGVQLGVAFMMRFQAQHQAALKMIQEGRLGKLTYARAQLSCWYPPMKGAWRQDPNQGGGGSLMDMGGHCVDLLEMFFGKVTAVSCVINNTVHDYKSEDAAVATLVFESGAMATVDTFFCIPDSSSKNVLEIYGSQGSILAKGTIGQAEAGEMIAYLEEGGQAYQAQQIRGEAQGLEISPKPINTYQAEIEEFSQALLDHREPANNAMLGLQSQKILVAGYQSAKLGRLVEIS